MYIYYIIYFIKYPEWEVIYIKMKKLISRLLSRNAAVVMLLLMQIAFLVLAIISLGRSFYAVYAALLFLDAVVIVYIMNGEVPSAYKLSWLIIISVFPVPGGVLYLFFKLSQRFPKSAESAYQKRARQYLVQDSETLDKLENVLPEMAGLARYVANYGLYPVYRNTDAEYYPLGEILFESMITELNKAERFIFMEFFIIDRGYMFDKISEILKRKAKEGLDIRIMYDGIGTGVLNSAAPFRSLEKSGIKCRAFNPFRPFLSSVQNNRDHRKIVVIDGNTAFSGGTNLADEYINRKERFGHWKDTAIRINGNAVWNYTIMFLQLWESADCVTECKNFASMKNFFYKSAYDGFVQPFSDSPFDNKPVGKFTYLELINNAKEYVYITTPYLIPDEEMLNALGFAAQKGVDVRIITPHLPDKWYVHMIAWNNYPKLICRGVRVYEYTAGFIHSKCCIADGKTAVIGTINFDFRSFYLHFESAAILYNCSVISDMKRDFDETADSSRPVTMKDCSERSFLKKIVGCLLNILAPLL